MKDLKEFRYPKDLNEALEVLRQAGGKAKVVAGGTSLTLTKDSGVEVLVDLSRAGLDAMTQKKGTLSIGACVTARELAGAPELASPALRALRDASKTAGPSGVRAALTIGGNVVQCYPWSDLPVALLALGARVQITGNEPRKIALTDLLERHPSKTLESDEIVEEFSLPLGGGDDTLVGSAFVKLSRTTTDYALATAAAWVKLREQTPAVPSDGEDEDPATGFAVEDLRIALGAVRPMPVAIEGLQSLTQEGKANPTEAWIEKAGEVVLAQVGPIADMRATVEHRNQLIKVASTRALREAVARATDGRASSGDAHRATD